MAVPTIRENLLAIKPYVPGKPIDEVRRELGIQGEIIKLASNENPLGPSSAAIAAIREAAASVHLYPDGNSFDLKAAVAGALDVSAASIICGNGSDEVIELVGKTYLSPGSEVIYAQPTFSEYEFAARIMGATCVPVALVAHVHDLSAMADAITPRTRVIFICNPNNPTGTIVKRQAVEAFMNRVPPEVLVVFDEAYFEFVDDTDYMSGMEWLRRDRNVVVLRTFSKIHGLAGLRVGYGLSKPEIVADLMRVREPFNVNLIAQSAGVAALSDSDHVRRSQSLVKREKEYVCRAFEHLGLAYIPTQANFVMVDVRCDCRGIFKAMMAKGIIVRTCDIFGMDTWLRVTFGTRDQNEKFLSTLGEVLGLAEGWA